MSKVKATVANHELSGLVSVVVLKGKHLRHDGEDYKQNTCIDLAEGDATRLITLGFVKALSVLQQEMDDVSPQEVSVTQADSQTTITTSKPEISSPENGAD